MLADILGFLIFLIIVFIILSKLIDNGNKQNEQREKWPYLKKNYLLSEAEKNFYFILSEILNNKFLLFSKVRISDLLYLPKNQDRRQFYHYWNKIQSKHVDFLICSKDDINPLLVIELDDHSHLENKRIERDNLVNQIFNDAKLPILHIKNSYNYDSADLKNKIASAMEIKSSNA